MDIKSTLDNVKIAAIAAELNYTLPKEIHMYEIMRCAKQLVDDFKQVSAAYTIEARLKLLN